MKKKNRMQLFDVINVLFMLCLLAIMIYPLYFTIVASLSDPNAVASGKVIWKPIGFTVESYKLVLENKKIWLGYANQLLYTVLGTIFSLLLTVPAAYVMSKKYLPYKGLFTAFFMVSMYFGGGMVPMYLLVSSLNLIDTRTIMVIIGGVSVYNMLVTKSFFQSSIPETIYEAARIDGAGEIKSFFAIALPLAKPVIAVITLYYAVGRWNDYFNALIYLRDEVLLPLQNILREILMLNQSPLTESQIAQMSSEEIHDIVRRQEIAYTMKYALVFIASAPLLIMYPFIQKYFVKGTMIGSVKE